MRVWRLLVVLAVLGTLRPASAADDHPLKGVALVIGESDYANLPKLQNPANDEKAVAQLFGDLGFDVTTAVDADRKKLQKALDRFVEDAADADVAVIYYSGHGIEAGGEDFLVPTDADVSTPTAAGDSVVSVSELLDGLRKAVPIGIVLLDACRSNAFPAGTSIALPGTAAPIAIDPTGLAVMRGTMPVAGVGEPDSLGMVVGFAAAPGMAALDGPPGGNSPYAAALLKQFGAGDYELGQVMSMISEEVYLKTDGRQEPWTSSSLRRILNFGKAPTPADPDEAAIATGRRALLLSIATTPEDVRKQVETAANEAAVPMDALYGLLQTLGQHVPSDPDALGALLASQTQRLKQLLDERRTLTSTDPEIQRFSRLAQEALDEGALDVSLSYWEKAKARFAEVSKTLDQAEADLEARRLEGGALLAQTGDTYGLAGNYAQAADNYEAAYQQVVRWDPKLAFQYKVQEADALTDNGQYAADIPSISKALDIYKAAIAIAPGGVNSFAWANTENSYGIALQLLGERKQDRGLIGEAADAFKKALGVWDRKSNPVAWATAENNLAALLETLGEQDTSPARLQQSVAAYREVLKSLNKNVDPISWAMSEGNLGNALSSLGERGDIKSLQQAVDAYDTALGILDRSREPQLWARMQVNRGTALQALGLHDPDNKRLLEAADAYRAALEINTRDRAPESWAESQMNLGAALETIGERVTGTDELDQSVTAFQNVLTVVTRDNAAMIWAKTEGNLARAYNVLGYRRSDTGLLQKSVDAATAALTVYTPDTLDDWAETESLLGNSLFLIGDTTHDVATLKSARQFLSAAWKAYRQLGQNYDTFYQTRLTKIDKDLASLK